MRTPMSIAVWAVISLLSYLSTVEGDCVTTQYCPCDESQGEPLDVYERTCTLGDVSIDDNVKLKSETITCNDGEVEGSWPATEKWPEIVSVDPKIESVSIKMCPVPATFGGMFDRSNVTDLRFEYGFRDNNLNFRPDIPKLRVLHLQPTMREGALGILPSLRGLPSLIHLYAGYNGISYLETDAFASNPRLETLDLGNNKLTILKGNVFQNLSHLDMLLLYGNRINFTEETFKHAVNIRTLDLSLNGLKTVPADLFRYLPNLESLSLAQNELTSLPEGLFQWMSRLSWLRLSRNKLKDVSLAGLTHLRVVTISDNEISELREDAFEGNRNLNRLEVRKNALQRLPANLFRHCGELKELDFGENKLKELNEETFASLKQLRKLRLDRNALKTIKKKTFSPLTDLEELYLDGNELKTVEKGAFSTLTSLKVISLSKNKLKMEEWGQSPFYNCRHLQQIDLNHNLIDRIHSDFASFTELSKLDISYNNLTRLNTDDLQFISSNVEVNLAFNDIQVVDLANLESYATHRCRDLTNCDDRRRNVRVELKGNPVGCDCLALDLARYAQSKMMPAAYNFVDLLAKDLVCPLKENQFLSDLPLEELVCDWDRIVEQDQRRESECPAQCSCYYRAVDKTVVTDCQGANFTVFPTKLPSLKGAFGNWLEFGRNRISQLHSLPDTYQTLTKLSLFGNGLTELHVNNFPNRLQVLELHENSLTKMDDETLRGLKNSQLSRITLRGNPWTCDCDSRNFVHFVKDNYERVLDYEELTCGGSQQRVSGLLLDDLCGLSTIFFISGVTIAAFGLFVGAAVAGYYRYRREIIVWMFSRRICLWLVAEKELDADKKFDAFVSYSHADESFVVDYLLPKLEKESDPPYQLCLHFRDWLAGDYIPNQIVRSVEESRRTIVILSKNFLNSVWAKMEFRTAHLKAIKEGCARVIVVLYNDIGPLDDLDPELRAYLTTNTYLKWDERNKDPWFWEKLRYALPHPDKYFKNTFSIPTTDALQKKARSKIREIQR